MNVPHATAPIEIEVYGLDATPPSESSPPKPPCSDNFTPHECHSMNENAMDAQPACAAYFPLEDGQDALGNLYRGRQWYSDNCANYCLKVPTPMWVGTTPFGMWRTPFYSTFTWFKKLLPAPAEQPCSESPIDFQVLGTTEVGNSCEDHPNFDCDISTYAKRRRCRCVLWCEC